MSGFYFPSTVPRARAVSSAIGLGGNVVIPQWPAMSALTFSNGTFSQIELPSGVVDPQANGSLLTGRGFSAIAAGASPSVYMLTYEDYLVEMTSTTAGTVYDLASGQAYLGFAYLNSRPYWLAASGNVYTLVSGVVTPVTSGFGVASTALATDGTKLYAACPGNGLGVLTLTGVASGSAAFVTAPMTNPYLIAASASGVAVAGYTPAGLSVGSSIFIGSPVEPSTVAVVGVPASNTVELYTGNDPAWSLTASATGITNPEWLGWVPTGEQVLVSETSANTVAVLNLSGNTLTRAQTLTVANAGQISFTPTSDQALVCQPSSNQVAVLNNSLNVWAVGTPISVTTPYVVLVLSETTAVCGNGTDLAYLSRVGNVWSVTSNLSLGFTPKGIAEDASGNLYLAGTSGSSGYLAIVSGGAVTNSANWTGSAAGVFYEQAQIAVIDTSVPEIRWFDTTLTAQGTQAVPSGMTQFGQSDISVWFGGTSTTWQMQLTGPFEFQRLNSSAVAVYESSSWATINYAVGVEPSALLWETTNTLYMVTAGNAYYQYLASGGSLTQTATGTVGVYTNQTPGTSLGMSSLSYVGGHLYATTFASGVLMRIL